MTSVDLISSFVVYVPGRMFLIKCRIEGSILQTNAENITEVDFGCIHIIHDASARASTVAHLRSFIIQDSLGRTAASEHLPLHLN